jgi:hypothetical protein
VRVRPGARSVTVQISSRRHMQLLSRGDLVDENDWLVRESMILTFGLHERILRRSARARAVEIADFLKNTLSQGILHELTRFIVSRHF